MNFDEIVKMDVHFFFYSFSFPECLMFFKMKIEEKKVNRSIFSEFEPWLSWHMPYIVFGSLSRGLCSRASSFEVSREVQWVNECKRGGRFSRFWRSLVLSPSFRKEPRGLECCRSLGRPSADPRWKPPGQVEGTCPGHCLISFCSFHVLVCVTSSPGGRGGTDGPRSLSALNRPKSFPVLKNLWFAPDSLASVVAVELSRRVLPYPQLPSGKTKGPAHCTQGQTEVRMMIPATFACKRRGWSGPEEGQGEVEADGVNTWLVWPTAAHLAELLLGPLGTCHRGWSAPAAQLLFLLQFTVHKNFWFLYKCWYHLI